MAAREAPWTGQKVHLSKTRDPSRASLVIQRFLGGIQADRSARQWVRESGSQREGQGWNYNCPSAHRRP